MKVGTFNYHNVYNYGALLESYALKRFIAECGHEAITVNYVHPILCQRQPEKNLHFDSFIEKYIMSRYESIDYSYDICVYGSDTIWSNDYSYREDPIDIIYGGDVAINTKKKISYSASAVLERFDQRTPAVFREYLKNFSSISVREDVFRDYLAPLTDKPVFHTCDPTLLIAKDDWMKIADEPLFSEPYGFIYNQLCRQSTSFEIAQTMEEKIKLPVYVVTGFLNTELYDARGHMIREDISPNKWLSLLFYADKVLVASFHGTAFSLNFQKDFFCLHNGFGGSRMDSLLRVAGIPERKVDHSSQMDFSKPIQWETVHQRLNRHISDSKKYLINSLNGM